MSDLLSCPDSHHAFHGGSLFPGNYECNDLTINRETNVTDDGDPQETVDILGDDAVIGRIVVPRVWHLPSRPGRGVEVSDRDGKVWKRQDGPEWVDLWISGGMNALHWHELLGRRGPLTEVM